MHQGIVRSEEGTTAVVFAVMLLSLIVLIGGGLDFSRHRTQSLLVQTAVDATVLHLVQDAGLAPDEISLRAREIFDANTPRLTASVVDFNASRSGEVLTVNAKAEVDTNFLGLLSIEMLPISIEAQSEFYIQTREVALVLDTTGSMAGDRLADLKTATHLLIDRLDKDTGSITGNNRIGVVPFNDFVRINPSDFQDNWLDNEGRSAPAKEIFSEEIDVVELFDHLNEEWLGCLRSRGGNLAFQDVAPVPGDFDTHFLPMFAYDEADNGSYANNYLDDGATPLDGISSVRNYEKYGISATTAANPAAWSSVSVSTPGATGPNRSCTSEAIMPLTNNFDEIRDAVDAFVADGDTHLTEAIVWGQRVLSDRAPYTNGLPADDANNRKILLLLSDGINSIDGGNADLRSTLNAQGYAAIGEQATLLPPNPSETDINDYLDDEFLVACQNIRATGTQIVVIRLELTDTDSLALLKDCASSEADFFDVPDSSDLETVFGEIARRITTVRLTR